jgi:Family of unknown function (DUF6325)
MTWGPLEYVVIEFQGNHFTGEILPELRSLHERGIIRVDDLVLIQRDQDGKITTRDVTDLSGEEARPFGPIAGSTLTMLSADDIQDLVDGMENNSSVAIAVLEHIWAVHLKETIAKASGRVLRAGLISPSEVDAWAAESAPQTAATHG